MHNDFNTYLAKERARSTTEQAKTSFASRVSMGLLTVAGLWSTFEATLLLGWFFIYALVSFCSLVAHRKLGPLNNDFNSSTWLKASMIGTFCVGFTWGLAPVLFFAYDDIVYLAFIIALYTGYIAGSLAVNFSHQPSFIASCVGVTIPFAGRMFYEADQPYVSVAWLAIFFVVTLTYVSRNMHKLFIKSAKNQFDNIQLLSQLAAEKEAVEQAVAAKDRFLASASHDLRQPLNAISLFADALRPLQTKPLGNQIVDKIRQSLKGLNGMLHSLLDISRLDANVVENQPKAVSLHTLVNQLCDEYREKAPHLTIQCEIDQQANIFIDPTILYRVVHNLIDNAVKYTPEGNVTINSYEADNNNLVLTIADSGIGIPQDKLSTVFGEFEQLGNPERNREKGLGLGLSIVRRLCVIANIDIQLESMLGEGTIVSLTLQNSDGTQPDGDSFASTTTDADFNGLLALVIDDEVDILMAMQHLLNAWGCRVIACESLQHALTQLSQQNDIPNFIISDLRLRAGEHGHNVIETIRDEFNKDIPAIVVTGDTAPDRIAAIEESGLKVLYKPIESNQLKQQLSALLAPRSA